MKNIKIDRLVQSLVGLSIVVFVVINFLRTRDISGIYDYYDIAQNVITIDLLVFALFAKWGWKWRIFKGWLVPFPDLNGTWKGTIKSDWRDPKTNKIISPISAYLAVKQSFMSTSCVLLTEQMISYSNSESFIIETDNQISHLIFSYSSRPRQLVAGKNPPHEGTARLRIISSPIRKLAGKYWTDRKTAGEMSFEFVKKGIIEEYPDAA